LFVKVTGHIALEVIGDRAQVVHFRVFDRERERRVGEQRNIQLACRNGGDHRRAAVEADRLNAVALAEVSGDPVLCEQDGREVCRRCDPADADLDRIRGARVADAEREQKCNQHCACAIHESHFALQKECAM
jgi:hypothetical protein